MLSEILLSLIVVIAVIAFFKKNGNNNLPPGPKGFPLVGTLPPLGVSYLEMLTGLRRQYGDIVSVRIGSRLVVGLMRYDLIKKAFAMPQMSARPDVFTLSMLAPSNTGILLSSGRPWINGRRFALTHLRDLGMGRSVMEDNIQEEARALVQDFEKNVGQPMEVSFNVNVAILNVIWKMIAGERFDLSNEEVHKLSRNIEDNINIIAGPMSFLDWFPRLSYLPEFIKNKYFEINRLKKNLREIMNFLEKVIKQHQDTLDPTNVRDYIDHYLVEMEAQKEDPNSTFKQDLLDLKISILNFYVAGSETTSSTIRWLILYMAVYPRIQERVQQELDEVVPKHRLAELQDKLPYLDAMVAETMRHIALVPFGIPHSTQEEVTLAGYVIPKDTIVVGYLRGCLTDPKLWDNPEEFRPERFLDEDGMFVTKENFVPFGSGRRVCVGESMARMELKLFTAAVLQNFTIAAPEGVTLNTQHDDALHRKAIINFAKPYKVVIKKRI